MYICNILQIYKQTSKKYEVYFNIFLSECRVYSRFTSNIATNEQETTSLLDCFLQRVRSVTRYQHTGNAL